MWMQLQIIGKELRLLGKQNEAQKLSILIVINLAGTIILLVWCHLTSSLGKNFNLLFLNIYRDTFYLFNY